MNPRPDFSPVMLSLFLRARAQMAIADSGEPWRRTEIVRACKARMRKAAGVTNVEFHMAWMGWLPSPDARRRLWTMLGHDPAARGIVLTHGGQEAADG